MVYERASIGLKMVGTFEAQTKERLEAEKIEAEREEQNLKIREKAKADVRLVESETLGIASRVYGSPQLRAKAGLLMDELMVAVALSKPTGSFGSKNQKPKKIDSTGARRPSISKEEKSALRSEPSKTFTSTINEAGLTSVTTTGTSANPAVTPAVLFPEAVPTTVAATLVVTPISSVLATASTSTTFKESLTSLASVEGVSDSLKVVEGVGDSLKIVEGVSAFLEASEKLLGSSKKALGAPEETDNFSKLDKAVIEALASSEAADAKVEAAKIDAQNKGPRSPAHKIYETANSEAVKAASLLAEAIKAQAAAKTPVEGPESKEAKGSTLSSEKGTFLNPAW